MTIHLKQGVHADVDATAAVVDDEDTRRWVLTHEDAGWYRGQTPLEELVADAPMVELSLGGEGPT